MYLAIDFGLKRIGLAIGEAIPKAAGVIDGSLSLEEIILYLSKICREEGIEKIILGMPIRSQGEEGTLGPKIRRFKQALEKNLGLAVVLEPEQFTSTEAKRYLDERGIKDDGKGKIDQIAAMLILEQYLSSKDRENK